MHLIMTPSGNRGSGQYPMKQLLIYLTQVRQQAQRIPSAFVQRHYPSDRMTRCQLHRHNLCLWSWIIAMDYANHDNFRIFLCIPGGYTNSHRPITVQYTLSISTRCQNS